MKNKKVAVIAGTTVDTQMGVDILKENGFSEVLFLPISKNCNEQNAMQYFSKDELYKVFVHQCEVALAHHSKHIFLYCNSLAVSVDWKSVAQDLNLTIITPLATYEQIPKNIKNLALICANAVAAFNIDKILCKHNPALKTISVGNLSITELIEEKLPPAEIIEKLNLHAFTSYLENIKMDTYKLDCILLACTHFPYLKKEIQKGTTLPIIDPTENMIAELKKAF